ncbi:MAG: M48 family metallopeptidase [Lachnospiraceae bacterium]|nr:M48 family metallopeptidase [Lachnospiraceae bacterium]
MDTILHIKYQSRSYELPYTLIRSKRKSYAISISPDGQITVRVPLVTSDREVRQILTQKQHWIVTKYLEQQEKQLNKPVSDLTDAQRNALTQRYIAAAKEYFPKRAAYFHQFTGGTYDRITIRDQKTRWGSCSARGTLSFNWRLMLAPPAILDYVVVHELCHLTHMNHSAAFWQAVESVYPDYRNARRWLKEHGQELIL